jgi:hypothetical protein
MASVSFFVQAEYPFTSPDGSALSFARGDVIEVLTQLESGWWDGLLPGGERGWFPSNYVRRIEDEEAERWFLAREQEAGVLDEAEEKGEEGKKERVLLHTEADPGTMLFYHPVTSPDMNNDTAQASIPAPNTRPAEPTEPGSPETDADFWIPSLTADGQVRLPLFEGLVTLYTSLTFSLPCRYTIEILKRARMHGRCRRLTPMIHPMARMTTTTMKSKTTKNN